jgi:hypothetical protein
MRKVTAVLSLAILCPILAACTEAPKDETTRARVPRPSIPEGKAGTPEATVLQLFSLLDLQVLPETPALYSGRVTEVLGARQIVDAFESQVPALLPIRVRVVQQKKVDLGQIVVVRLNLGDRTARYSFILQREGDRWRIVYDTLLADGLRFQGQLQAQRRIAPRAEQPSPQAVEAGNRAARVYRNLLIPAGSWPSGGTTPDGVGSKGP